MAHGIGWTFDRKFDPYGFLGPRKKGWSGMHSLSTRLHYKSSHWSEAFGSASFALQHKVIARLPFAQIS